MLCHGGRCSIRGRICYVDGRWCFSHFASVVQSALTSLLAPKVRISDDYLIGFCSATVSQKSTADPLRQVFQIAYAQAPQLYVAQYLQPNLHLCLAHDSGLASFVDDTFFWLVYRAPLTAETGISRCWRIHVTAMFVWTPRVMCEEWRGSHNQMSFTATIVAVWITCRLCCPG